MPLLWDEGDRKYKCCCDGVHIAVGSVAIGVVETVGSVVVGAVGLEKWLEEGWDRVGLTLVILAVVAALLVVLLFLGLRREAPLLLIPHLVFQVWPWSPFLFRSTSSLGGLAVSGAAGGVDWIVRSLGARQPSIRLHLRPTEHHPFLSISSSRSTAHATGYFQA